MSAAFALAAGRLFEGAFWTGIGYRHRRAEVLMRAGRSREARRVLEAVRRDLRRALSSFDPA